MRNEIIWLCSDCESRFNDLKANYNPAGNMNKDCLETIATLAEQLLQVSADVQQINNQQQNVINSIKSPTNAEQNQQASYEETLKKRSEPQTKNLPCIILKPKQEQSSTQRRNELESKIKPNQL